MNEIKEMAKILKGYCCLIGGKPTKGDCYQCKQANASCFDYAKLIYNAGYRNCKDKIVLDKEVFNKNYVLIDELLLKQELAETLKKVASAQEKTIKLLREELAKAKKETARGIINKVDDMIGGKMIAQALREIYEVEE